MKAIQLEQPQQFRRIEVPEAARPAAGEALVRVHRVGICGTDYGGYLGKMPFSSYPRIPGHELGVEVLEVGDGVTNVALGDRATVAGRDIRHSITDFQHLHAEFMPGNPRIGIERHLA